MYRQVGHQDELGWVLSMDAFCYLACGETEQAKQRLVEALEIALSIHAYFVSPVRPGCWRHMAGQPGRS